jgi:mannose-6-phosphate isomerase-like protein (cupin superfamily)
MGMRVTPSDLRAVRRRELTLRSARLGPVAAVLVEAPGEGSRQTPLEEPCEEPHWSIVLRGELELRRGRGRWRLLPGDVFHVPAGSPPHRFFAARLTVLAGFVPLPDGDASGDMGSDRAAGNLAGITRLAAHSQPPRLAADGERGTGLPRTLRGRGATGPLARPPNGDRGSVVVARRLDGPAVPAGEVEAEAVAMGPWVMARACFGPTSGYGANWCDLPHWGLVVSGGAAIEYEDDVEVVGPGDFYYCPPGPPGHRLEVADAALVVDFTPQDLIDTGLRIEDWRARVPVLEPAR